VTSPSGQGTLSPCDSPDSLEGSPAALRPGDVHVWSARLDLSSEKVAAFSRLLDPDEAARASRFRFDRDRRAFAISRGMLRAILALYLSRPRSEIRFHLGAQGKPAIRPDLTPEGLHFNVTHSGALALFALSASFEVGIDVEAIRAQPDLEDIAERFFSVQEVDALRARPAADRNEGFFSCWTAKEAYIKGRGEGLSMPLDGFAVSLEPREGPVELRALDRTRPAGNWSIHRFRPEPGYIAALAVESERFRLSYHSPESRSR
jgi:4'-phosphopantetheinyl transferase